VGESASEHLAQTQVVDANNGMKGDGKKTALHYAERYLYMNNMPIRLTQGAGYLFYVRYPNGFVCPMYSSRPGLLKDVTS